MKRFLLLIGAVLAVSAAADARVWRPGDVPNVQLADRSRYVSNPDGILSAGAVARLDSLCGALRGQGLAQVAVAALDDIEGGDTFTFAMQLFGGWGVGRKDVDNGLGILLVRDLHEIRFVTGPGLEGVLPDALCKRIQLNFMLPYFREGDYDAGMVAGVGAVAELLVNGELDFGPESDEEDTVAAFVAAGCMFVLLMLLVGLIVARELRKCPRCGKRKLREASSQIVTLAGVRTLERTFVCRHCGKVVTRRSELDSGLAAGAFTLGGGFGRGGSSGGGFGGGFGGGSFGGGGAGSRW